MTKYSVDWGHKDDKLVYFDGKKIIKRPKFKDGDELFGENIPFKYCRKLFEKNVRIFRIHANLISDFRKSKGIEKTDEADARLIYEYYTLHPDDFKPYTGEPVLKLLYVTFKEVQKLRVSTSNRLWAMGEDDNNGHLFKDLQKIEKDVVKQMRNELVNYPIWDWLQEIKGINVATASGLLAYIGEVKRFQMVSSLNSYAGLGVHNGLATKKRKGESMGHHPKLKSLLLGIIGDSFIKQRTPVYRGIYDSVKKKELVKEYPAGFLKEHYNGYKKDDTKLLLGHAHNRAIRKMMKIFLQHYWVLDRQLHKLDTRPPYVHEHLKHKSYIMPSHIPESLLPFKPF